MPNWCSNVVEFTGDEEQLAGLKKLFEIMAAKESETQCGQLPDFISAENGGYFFDTRWEDEILYYETKWSPNTEVLKQVADHFQTGFTSSYAEPGNFVYGEVCYRDGEVMENIELDHFDSQQYKYDEASDKYAFEGQIYESDAEIIEALLERKRASSGPQKNGFGR